MRRNYWLQIVVCGLLTAAGLAQAQAPPAVVARMRALDLECQAHMHRQDFSRRALRRYRLAWALDEQVGNDSLRAKHAYLSGICYTRLNRFDSAAAVLRLSTQLYLQQADYGQAVAAAGYLADAYARQRQPDSARAVQRRLEAEYPRTRPNTGARANLDEFLASAAQDAGEYARSLRHRLAVVAYRRLRPDTANLGITLINVGELFYLQNQHRKALAYRQEGLRWVRLDPDMAGMLPEIHALIGKTYRDLGQPDSARRQYETALRLLTPTSDPDVAGNIHAELGMVLGQLGHLPEARRHARRALASYAQSADLDGRCQAYFFAGEVELQARSFGPAQAYLRQAYRLAVQLENKDRYEPIFRQLATAEARLGHFAEAYRLRDRAAGLLDSAHNTAGQQAMATMEARYQNHDKQRQIGLLNAENRLRTAQAAAQRRSLYAALAGVAALLLGLGLIGFLLRQRQRAAALLATQNEVLAALNQRLNGSNAQLAEANRAKAQLFSIVSHDLRAPVSNLFQLLELTQTAPHLLDEATRQQQTAHLRQSARDLLDTMEELLAWSKDQLDGLEPVPENLALAPLLAELTALYAPLAQRKNIELITACPPGLHLRTDPNFLRVILRNLVQNALKFTPADGQVRIEAETEPNPAGRITLRVADTGPGLSPAQLAQLLAPAGSAEAAPPPSADPAHGLGLRLTQEFVAKLGGELRAQSEPGAGTVFEVVL